MRPIYLSDLDAVVRAALAVPFARRPVQLREWVAQAQIADVYRKRLKRPHHLFGTGTLESVVQRAPKANATSADREYRMCLSALLAVLDASHEDQGS